MIKTVIFDLDDTLYDEIEYCRSGFRAIANYLAEKTLKASPEHVFSVLWEQFNTSDRTKVFNNTLNELSIDYDKDFIITLVNVYRSHIPDIVLPDDSRQILELLTGKYPLGLITDGFLPAQQLKVQALGIENYFQAIIYTEQLGRQHWKPDTLAFEKILESLNISPKNAVYVADNEKKDFIAPNKLKMHSIKMTRSAKIHKNTADTPIAKAEYEIEKLSQISEILVKL